MATATSEMYGRILLGQLGQSGQSSDNSRRALAARLMAGSPPAAPITSPTSALAYALSRGLEAWTGRRMADEADQREDARWRERMGLVLQHEQQQQSAAADWGTGYQRLAAMGPVPEPQAPPRMNPAYGTLRSPTPPPAPADGDPRSLNMEAARRREAVLGNTSLTPEQQAQGLAEVSAWRAGAGGTPPIPGGYRANQGVDGAFAGVAPPSGMVPPVVPGGAPPGVAPGGGALPGAVPGQAAMPSAGAAAMPGQPTPQQLEMLRQGLASPNPMIRQQAQAALQVLQLQRQGERQPQTVQTAEGVFVLGRDGRLGPRLGGLPRDGMAGEGPFRGTGMDAQAANILLGPSADPSSPTYAAAFQHLYGPRLQTQPDGTTIIVQPQPPHGIRPPGAAVPQVAAGGADPAGAVPGGVPGPVAPAAPAVPQRPTVSQQTPAGTVTRVPGRGSPLSDSASRDLSDLARTAGEWNALRNSFRPDFGGFGSDTLGDLTNSIARNTPGASPRAEWWQRYNLLANIERNELFGSALTAGEQAAWRAAMIGPGMNADQIRLNMSRQAELAHMALFRRARTAVANGTNIEAIAAATGLPVEALMTGAMGGPPATPPPPPGFEVVR